jgi:hypothetical protein
MAGFNQTGNQITPDMSGAPNDHNFHWNYLLYTIIFAVTQVLVCGIIVSICLFWKNHILFKQSAQAAIGDLSSTRLTRDQRIINAGLVAVP